MPATASAESLFFAALDLPLSGRAAFLDSACGGDTELRARIEKMLAAQPDMGEFLDRPAVTLNPDLLRERPTQREISGAVITEKYKLVEPIGQGGMGAVWVAEQLHPVRRRVAVKLIRNEFDGSRGILTRFEAERQAIALMDHPHIAKLLEAGTTGGAEADSVGTGRPYFVMELVDGVPLNEYCDTHKLTVHDRLGLFVHICRAVQHAHQKGIIHRDLKPSNILVEHHDGRPVPRVIDFGLAKATGGVRLTDDTLHTQPGNVAGTPLYMAPEQADLDTVDIDTRADVYALGVNLYELLTGTTPIEREQLKKAPLLDLLHVIRDSDPPTPSRRLSSTAATADVAANRQTEPARLGRFVRGDLDWIVMKALAKERERRYESATEFAADVERFLHHEPVLAGPPSAAYRLRKFARRHRIQVIAAALLVLVLLAGIGGTTFGLIRAEHRRGEAENAQQHEVAQRTRAERARDRTWEALEAMTSWVTGEALSTQPTLTDEQRRFLTEVLAYYREFAAEQADDESTRARTAAAAHRVSKIGHRLGRTPEAVVAVRTARDAYARLVADFPTVPEYRERLAGAQNDLGLRLNDLGKPADAEKEVRQALSMRRDLATEFPDSPSYRQQLAESYTNLGVVLAALGNRAGSVEEHHKAIAELKKLVDDHPKVPQYRQDLARSHSNLSGQLLVQKERTAAEEHIREALALLDKLVVECKSDPTHRTELAAGHANLGVVLAALDNPRDAVTEYRKSLEILEKLSADFPGVPDYRHQRGDRHFNLGLLLVGLKKRSDAEKEFRKALDLQEPLATDFPAVPVYRHHLVFTRSNLADLLNKSGNPRGAEEQLRKAVDLWRRLADELPPTPSDRDTRAANHSDLGVLLFGQRKLAEAEEQFRFALEVREKLVGEFPDVTKYQTSFGGEACNMGSVLTDSEHAKDGLVWFEKAIRTLTAARERDRASADARNFLTNSHAGRAVAYHQLQKYGEAVQDWDRAVELDPKGEKQWMRAMRTLSRVKAGQATEAVAEVAELANWPIWDGSSWTLFAGVYAQASSRVKDKKEEYAARAVELLRKATKAGYRDPDRIEKDEDLDPLHDRDDFKKLLADLRKK